MHFNLGKAYKCLRTNIELKPLYQLNFVDTSDGDIILNYKDMQELMISPAPLKLMDTKNKVAVHNFVSKLVSRSTIPFN